MDKNSNMPLSGLFVLFIKLHTKVFLLCYTMIQKGRVCLPEHFHMLFIFFWAIVIFLCIFEVHWNFIWFKSLDNFPGTRNALLATPSRGTKSHCQLGPVDRTDPLVRFERAQRARALPHGKRRRWPAMYRELGHAAMLIRRGRKMRTS